MLDWSLVLLFLSIPALIVGNALYVWLCVHLELDKSPDKGAEER